MLMTFAEIAEETKVSLPNQMGGQVYFRYFISDTK